MSFLVIYVTAVGIHIQLFFKNNVKVQRICWYFRFRNWQWCRGTHWMLFCLCYSDDSYLY